MNKLKFQKITVLSICIFAILAITSLQSCDKNEDIVRSSNGNILLNDFEYLDADTSSLANPSDKEEKIIEAAKLRIDPFVVCENKVYRLTINSGDKIKISDRLFDYFRRTVEHTNILVKKLNVTVDERDSRILHVCFPSHRYRVVRLKVLGYESVPTAGKSSWNIDWSGIHWSLNQEDASKLKEEIHGAKSGATISAIYASYVGQAEVTAIAGLCAWGLDEWEDALSNNMGTGGVQIDFGLLSTKASKR